MKLVTLLLAVLATSACVKKPGGKLDVDSPLVPYKVPAEADSAPAVDEPEEEFPVPEIPQDV